MCSENDMINKTTKVCGCVITSRLDIINNLVYDYPIKLCKLHYKKKEHGFKYKYNKLIKLYECKGYLQNKCLNIKKKEINNIKNKPKCSKSSSSYYDDKIINFGKYKNKSFEYVYNNDKSYSFNIAFWKDISIDDDSNIEEFKLYIKKLVNNI